MIGKSANFNLKNAAIYSKIAPNAAEKRPWGCWRGVFQVFWGYFHDEKWLWSLFLRREMLTFFALVFLTGEDVDTAVVRQGFEIAFAMGLAKGRCGLSEGV